MSREPDRPAAATTGEPPEDPPAAGSGSFGTAAALTYGTSIVVGVLSLVNVLIMARALGPTGRGEVVLLTTLATLSAFGFALSVQEANANLAAAEPRTRRALAGNSLVFALSLGALGAVAVVALVALVPSLAVGIDRSLIVAAAGSLPILMLQTSLIYLVRADYRFALANVATVLVPVANVIVNGTLAAFGILSVGLALGTWIAAQAAATALLTWYVARRLSGFGAPRRELAGRSVRFGLQTHLSGLLASGNYRVDHLFVASLAGTRELGLYSVACAWVESLFLLPTALAVVLRPDLVRADRDRAGIQAAAVARVAMLITLPLVIAMALAAPILCVTVFGEEFRESVSQLRWLLPGVFGILLIKTLGCALVAQGRPLLDALAMAAAFAVTLIADIVLIPRFGGDGAAIASTLAYCSGGLAAAVIFLRTLGRRPADLVPRPADLAVLAALGRRAVATTRRTNRGG